MDEAGDRNSTPGADLEPLATALQSWFASKRKFTALPRKVRAQVRCVPRSALLIEVWDMLSPGQRRTMVQQLDLNHAEVVLRHEARIRGIEWPDDPTWAIPENVPEGPIASAPTLPPARLLALQAPHPPARGLLLQKVIKALLHLRTNGTEIGAEPREHLQRKVEEQVGSTISRSTLERALRVVRT